MQIRLDKIEGDSLFKDAMSIVEFACKQGAYLYGNFAKVIVKKCHNHTNPGNVNTINLIFTSQKFLDDYVKNMGNNFKFDQDRYIWKELIEVKLGTKLSDKDIRFDVDCLFIKLKDNTLVYETFGQYDARELCYKIVSNQAEILKSHLLKCYSNNNFMFNINVVINNGLSVTYKNCTFSYLNKRLIEELLAN